MLIDVLIQNLNAEIISSSLMLKEGSLTFTYCLCRTEICHIKAFVNPCYPVIELGSNADQLALHSL